MHLVKYKKIHFLTSIKTPYMFRHQSAILGEPSRTKEFKSNVLIQALLERLNY